MSVWYCAAIVFGGDAPELPALAPEPLLHAKPLKVQAAPCTDCGGKVLPRPPAVPRQPIERQALPPLAPPVGSVPLSASAQSPNVYAMPVMDAQRQLPQPASEMPTVVYGRGLDPSSLGSAPTRKPWWKRIFGREVEAPTRQITNASSAAMVASAPMPATAGRALQRQTWRTQEPPSTTIVHVPTDVVAQPALQPVPESAPTKPVVRTTERDVHTVRKPASATSTMIRDSSVWEYRNSTRTSDRTAAVPAKPDGEEPVVTAAAGSGEPIAEAPSSPTKQEWAEEVVRKTLEYRETKESVADKAAADHKGTSETLSGAVSWSKSGGGHWLLIASGEKYVLRGDASLLRLQVGDEVEVQGFVRRGGASGVSTMTVEKLSLSARR